jgi:NADPH:quinone reductase-like Zn-dependent oxidoreductase/malonyl CoA-acyl carrier protein transacylase
MNANRTLDELSKDAKTSRVSDAQISQPACTVLQLALTDLLKSWGISPTAVVGHSSGEIAAAYAAGVLSLESSIAIAYYRGQAVVSFKKRYPDLKGGMLAVGGSAEEIQPMIESLTNGKATIACINSPSSITASGDEAAIDSLAALIEEKQMFNRKLRVDTAYHSHHMDLAADEYGAAIAGLKPNPAAKAVFHSSLKGHIVSTNELDSTYWVQNLTCPVRFSEALDTMCRPENGSTTPGIDVLVEIGPHAGLEGPVKQILKAIGGNATKVAYGSVLLRNKDAVDTALQLAATMFNNGAVIDTGAINFPFPNVKAPALLTNLPKYVWNHSKKYWHESRIADQHSNRKFPRSDIVGTLANYSNDVEPTWRNIIRADDVPWVRHHKMQNMTVYPMAGYMAMAMEASAQRATMRNVAFDKFELREITVSRPLVIQEGSDVETQITLRAHAEGTRTSSDTWDEFRILSWAKDRSWIEHCRGLISAQTTKFNVVDGAQQQRDEKAALFLKKLSYAEACKSDVNTEEMYRALEEVGVGYGETFQGLEKCRAGDEHAVADLIIPDTVSLMPKHHEADLIIHPAFLDQFIQIVWPIFGAGWKGLDLLYMPSFVQSMSIKTGVTRTIGDRLRVFGSGRPTPLNPSPTKLNLFATSLENGDEVLISMEDLVMTPVSNGGGSIDELTHRELCYKLEWEPLASKSETNGVDRHAAETNGHDAVTNGHADLDIAIIGNQHSQQSLISSVQNLIGGITHRSPVSGSLGSVETEDKICIVVQELAESIVSKLDSTAFQHIQKMLAGAAGVLWVVRGAYTASQNPDAEMVVGMARSVRSETLLKFVTLDLGTSPQLPDNGAAQTIIDVLKTAFVSNISFAGVDMEYQERNGELAVPRVVNHREMNKIVHQETQAYSAPDLQPFAQEGRALKIAIRTPGALDTIYFTDDLAVGTPLPEYEVEIQVKATSMNFKDIMIAMGQLSSKYLGVECAGVISAVGSKVTDLVVGDRVAAMSEGSYSTYTRCLGTSCQKISDSLSFEDASTIPVIYCTAYYSLFDLARLSEGESVLIHAAAGGVGQAAIILSKMIGAEIFATVGSVVKKLFLMEEYGIPEDHIFYSRDTSFAKAIKRATNGNGVDVVLNSLASDALRETWDSLAHFGRFIEIGKRDITGNTRLEMSRFEHNALFASVDLTVVAAERPKIMKRLLSDVFALMDKGLAKPISPITIFSLGNVESAFRTLQSGKIMGKIVLVPEPGCKVLAVPSKLSKNLLKENATYIIIGGTGGLGRSMTRWMISRGARNIVLLSRSGSAEGKVGELISDAASLGAQVIVRSCDVTNQNVVHKLIHQDLSHLPAVKGVVHSAMVLHDVLFEKMTFDQWQAVVESKVTGAWNFHNALLSSPTPLDFFVLISSAAGAVGNRGQAAYAAANTFLNSFAQYRLQMGLPASSIDLTAVSDIGYLAENAERQAQVAENLGSETINGAEIMALMGAAIGGNMTDKDAGCSGHCITGLKLTPDTRDLFWAEDAKFAHLKAAVDAEAAESNSNSLTASASLSSLLKAAKTKEEALPLVCQGLMTKVSAVLMVPVEDMDVSRPIVAYGLDSLVAIEIRNWITRELEASLQVLELLTSSSITNLGETILQKSKLVNFSAESKTE